MVSEYKRLITVAGLQAGSIHCSTLLTHTYLDGIQTLLSTLA